MTDTPPAPKPGDESAKEHGCEHGYVIAKLGGSIITDKTRLQTADEDAIERFAAAFGALPVESRRRLLLVAGGGSFGNSTAHPDFAPDAPDRIAASLPVIRQWAAIFERAWHRAGPPCQVFTADHLLRNVGRGARFDATPLFAALAEGRIPVMMPGVVFQQRRTNLVSSDLMPLFASRVFKTVRFAALSDVAGVRISGETVPRIAVADRRRALDAATQSDKPDATGGMKLKLQVMLRMASQDVEGVICSGRPELVNAALFTSPPPGTWILPGATDTPRPTAMAAQC